MGGNRAMTWNVFSYVCSRCDALYEITVKAETMTHPICCAIETTQIGKVDATAAGK